MSMEWRLPANFTIAELDSTKYYFNFDGDLESWFLWLVHDGVGESGMYLLMAVTMVEYMATSHRTMK